jgi:NADH:ubiquinone oxidoreductase subunit 2 (subunit N)
LLSLKDFLIIIPSILLLITSWSFFIKKNFSQIRVSASYSDVLQDSTIFKKNNNHLFSSTNVAFIIYLLSMFFFSKGVETQIFNNHLFITNFNFLLTCVILFLGCLMFYIYKYISIKNAINSDDYFFSIFGITTLIYYIFLSNSFYNFVFVLELISILIFYKFILSRSWALDSKNLVSNKNMLNTQHNRNYINVIFFQYWVNFFSSVIIIFSVINIITLFGASDWFFLNLINSLNNSIQYVNDYNHNYLIWLALFIGFFLKIGLTPTHLFKVEVYKGIPFVSIFFYTTFYFLSYFLYICLFVFSYLNSFKDSWWLFFNAFIIAGIVYIVFLLFDVNFIKAFFAYSTIANGLGFFCLVVSTI